METVYFIGVDIGTQGVRVVLLSSSGEVVSTAGEVFSFNEQMLIEQSPEEWWSLCLGCLKKMRNEIEGVIPTHSILSIAVTSTSGTVIPLDENNTPLHPAIMYSDKRSSREAELCQSIAHQENPEGYTGFNSSSGLPKMIWFGNQYPEKATQIRRWVHAADFITGKLSNKWGITDYTNALKSGYDIEQQKWPGYLFEKLPLKKEWLPEVVASGTPIGELDPAIAKLLNLSGKIKVVTGITDGCASQVASGAVNPGNWNTTIGTTLVIKGVTLLPVKDPFQRLYNHRHPDGFWMPGGAGNIGADWVTKNFTQRLEALNEEAEQIIPSGHLSYPLMQKGERFPFISPEALGFEAEGLNEAHRYTANMEGVAYVERYAYELIEKLSGEKVNSIFTAGGASNSDTWLTIRANVLNRPVYKMKAISGAVGAAILAASKTHFTSLSSAVDALVQIEKTFYPNQALAEQYNNLYAAFIDLLTEKKYLNGNN